jgi:hypothetical protein
VLPQKAGAPGAERLPELVDRDEGGLPEDSPRSAERARVSELLESVEEPYRKFGRQAQRRDFRLIVRRLGD